MEPSDEPTYWIMPFELVDPRHANPDSARYRALFTYIVLFGGPVVFSDSAAVGNRFFRLALRGDVEKSGDGFTCELVDRGYLRFAIREQGGLAKSLADTADDIAARAGHQWVGYEPLGDMPEFRYVEEHGHLLHYSLDGAAARFQREILRVFSSAPFGKDLATFSFFGRVRYVWDRVHELREHERASIRRAAEDDNLRKQIEAAEAEKEGLVEELVRAESPTIDAAVIVDKPGIRDFSVVVRP